jgi:hypothetical protein
MRLNPRNPQERPVCRCRAPITYHHGGSVVCLRRSCRGRVVGGESAVEKVQRLLGKEEA